MSWLDDLRGTVTDLTGSVKSVAADVADTKLALKVFDAPEVEQARIDYVLQTAAQNGIAAGSVSAAQLYSANRVNRAITTGSTEPALPSWAIIAAVAALAFLLVRA